MGARLRSSGLLRGAAALMLATAAAQGLPLLAAPALARLYRPEDFGHLALFMVVPQVLTCMVMGRYEQAIQLPAADVEAMAVAVLALHLAAVSSLVLALLGGFFAAPLAQSLGAGAIVPWFKVVPLFVFCAAAFQVVRAWSLRKRRFGEIAWATLYQAVLGVSTSVLLGLLGGGVAGLILGAILGQTAGFTRLGLLAWRHESDLMTSTRLPGVLQAARRHWGLSKTLLFADAASAFSGRIPVFFISASSGAAMLGQYSAAERLAWTPIALVSRAIGDSYHQHAIELYHRQGRFDKLVWKTVMLTASLAVVPFALAIGLAPTGFALLLGPRWRPAGELGQILLVGAFVSFIVSPLDRSPLIVRRHGYVVAWQTIRGVLDGLAAWTSWRMGWSIQHFLWLLVANRATLYAWDLVMVLRFARGSGPAAGAALQPAAVTEPMSPSPLQFDP